MPSVIKDINWSLFKGTEEEEAAFKELLTYVDPAAAYTKIFRRGYWDGRRRLYKKTTYGLIFRSGLTEFLKEKFPGLEVKDVTSHLPTQLVDLTNLRQYQVEAIRAVQDNRA